LSDISLLWQSRSRPESARQEVFERHLAADGVAQIERHRQAGVNVAGDDLADVGAVDADLVGEVLNGAALFDEPLL
jgi:hypothetical protein